MDAANSFAKLLMQTFQEMAKEGQGSKDNKDKTNAPVTEKATHKKLDDKANHNPYHRNAKQHKQTHHKKRIHSKPQRNRTKSADSDIRNEKKTTNKTEENLSNLEDFVVSMLKFAPNQTMIISELVLKITDLFDKSIKQITGLKSKSFFDGMSEKQIIKIQIKHTSHGSLSFVQLISKKTTKKNTGHKKNHSKEVINEEIKNKTQKEEMSDKKKDNCKQMICDDAIDIVRCAILKNFLDGTRERIMLSSVSAYCYKYTGMHWKKVMIQKPKEFVNDMVLDGLLILDKETRNKSSYPFIVLNKSSPRVKQLDLDQLTTKMSKYNTKKRKRETLEPEEDGPQRKKTKIENSV